MLCILCLMSPKLMICLSSAHIAQGDIFLEPQIHAGITRFEIDMVLVTFIKYLIF